MGFQVKAITGAGDTSGDNGYTLFPEPQSGKNQWTRQKGYIDPGKQIAFKKIIYLACFSPLEGDRIGCVYKTWGVFKAIV